MHLALPLLVTKGRAQEVEYSTFHALTIVIEIELTKSIVAWLLCSNEQVHSGKAQGAIKC